MEPGAPAAEAPPAPSADTPDAPGVARAGEIAPSPDAVDAEAAEPDALAVDAPPPNLDTLAVPPPPGAELVETEVRYPIPTPSAVASDEPEIRISSSVTTRLRSLDANLQALAARGGSNVVNAVLALLTGGLAITLGAVRPNPIDEMSIYLYLYGGTAAARGVLEFALTPDAQGASIRYQHMPMTTQEEVRARLDYGESALSGLAEHSLIARVLDGSLNLAVGVAVVPIFAAKDFSISDPLDYFVLIGAGVSLVSGIITLASTSGAEQRWTAYRALRDRLREDEPNDDRASVDALDAYLLRPAPAGPTLRFGLASLSLTF